ncbi:DUF4405 domain-containing protein [Mitsuokella sp. WILCCON 0060]|uniref:DUF4405 domain-containing protein n=1 Tax=unclassified Mitsuokella TaxID=2637239 RepID=UPI003F0EDABC
MRYLLDVLLLLLLVFEMSFLYLPPFFHEVVGAALLIPIFVHLYQNRFFFKALTKGRWSLPRVLGAAVNLLLAAACLTSMISGCLISNILFADIMPLSLRSNPVLFSLHSASARWFLVFAGLHFGLHASVWWQKLQRTAGITSRPFPAKALMGVMGLLLAAGGIYAALQDKLLQRLEGAHVFMTPALQYDTAGYILTQLGMFLLFAEAGWLLWQLALQRRP